MSNHRVEITGQEMVIKAAKAIGYTVDEKGVWTAPADKYGTTISGTFKQVVPKFDKSLDACDLFKKHMTAPERKKYAEELRKFCTDKRDPEATNAAAMLLGPIERLESFVRLKGLYDPAPVAESGATVGV